MEETKMKDIHIQEWFNEQIVLNESGFMKVSDLFSSFLNYHNHHSLGFSERKSNIFVQLLRKFLSQGDGKIEFFKRKVGGQRFSVVSGVSLRVAESICRTTSTVKCSTNMQREVLKGSEVLSSYQIAPNEYISEEAIIDEHESPLCNATSTSEGCLFQGERPLQNDICDVRGEMSDDSSSVYAGDAVTAGEASYSGIRSFTSEEANDVSELQVNLPLAKSVSSPSTIKTVTSFREGDLKSKPKRTLFNFFNRSTSFNQSFGKPVYKEKPFPFRQIGKEPMEYNNLVFSRHYENFKQITPANLPSSYATLEEFLEMELNSNPYHSDRIKELLCLAKYGKNGVDLILKAFLCASFNPIKVGNIAPTFFNYLSGATLPQFTVAGKSGLTFKCEICKIYGEYLACKGKSTTLGKGNFLGFRQLYEHAVSNHHKASLDWLKLQENGKAFDVARTDPKPLIIDYFDIESKKLKKVPCFHLWDSEIVSEFKGDSGIRGKQSKTIFFEKKLWKKCQNVEGHDRCNTYLCWKKLHQTEFKLLSQEASKTFCSVYVPGRHSLFINNKNIEIDGGIKSLDPTCLGTAYNFGVHPFTCDNCEKQRVYLRDLMMKRQNAALITTQNRIGKRGFRLTYATKSESEERFRQLNEENNDLAKQVKKFERVQYDKKAWESMLLRSCGDDDINKLVVDLVSLFQQPGNRGSIQFQVLRNLIGKLKSKNNHKFTDIIKDIACVYKNTLGPSNYSLLQNLFGLPGRTCAEQHAKIEKLSLGFNENVFQICETVYKGEPVIDATDEARLLRFISPILNNDDQIELVGHCWDADCSDWKTSKTLLSEIISNKNFPDQFTALKHFVDGVINTNKLAKDVALHNFATITGVMTKPRVYLIWPTPNSGYQGYHLMKIWDELRCRCFVNPNGTLKERPVNLLGHASDSAGFQLAAAVCLMTPNAETLKAGVKYLTLGIGASRFVAPYFGPLPSIAYLDYDHELRLFLKCLKYTTLELNLFPSKNSSHIVSVEHLKELKVICDEYGYSCSFSNNDLLFARFLDQNCDAALKVFRTDVAKLLEENVTASNGTVLYIKAVVALFKPFLEPCSDPTLMQESLSEGIAVFRIWKKILSLKNKRIHCAPGAAKDPSKRGFFLTYGCAQTAEILFSAATSHMLAMFAHFKHLGPSALSPFKCGTKSTERLVSELQGKTNFIQSLDAQPTLGDVISKLSKVQVCHLAEDRILEEGGQKQTTTNRRRLSHKLKEVEKSKYNYPETFSEFLESQRNACKAGFQKGVELFRLYCTEGVLFLENKGGFSFLYENEVVPELNRFDGSITTDFALQMLNNVRSAEVLSSSVTKNEKDIREFFEAEENAAVSDTEVGNSSEKGDDHAVDIDNTSIFSEADDITIIEKPEISEPEAGKDSSRWYLTKLENGKEGKIHIRQALKFLIPREFVFRDRARRHIASTYLPGKAPIHESHNVIAFRYVMASISSKVVVCKVASLLLNGTSVPSASSENESATCRLIPLEEKSPFIFEFPNKVYVSKEMKVSKIINEIGMNALNGGQLQVSPEFRSKLSEARKKAVESLDHSLAKEISKSIIPLEFEEVDDILRKKIDPKTEEFLYLVKFKDNSSPVWLNSSCFDRPVHYSSRKGLSASEVLYARRSENAEEVKLCSSLDKNLKENFPKISRKRKINPVVIDVDEHDEKRQKLDISIETLDKLKRFCNPKFQNSIVPLKNPLALSENQWLSDAHMKTVSDLIKKEFPDLKGLQETVDKPTKSYKSVSGDSAQIHHDKKNKHWVLSVSMGGRILVYDSLSGEVSDILREQLFQCYSSLIKNNTLEVTLPKVYKQQGGIDCGLFVTAYLIDIANGLLPDNECYIQSEMRAHFNNFVLCDKLFPFPRYNSKDRASVLVEVKEAAHYSLKVV